MLATEKCTKNHGLLKHFAFEVNASSELTKKLVNSIFLENAFFYNILCMKYIVA